jgi:hypothetical protein
VFERNAYFYGKQFTVRDLLLEQRYLNEKRWLVNRMVAGHGVVCGLDVRWEQEQCALVVGVGLALDCCGREILICEPARVAFEEYPKLCEQGQAQAGQEQATPGEPPAEQAEERAEEGDDVDAAGYDRRRHGERFVLCLEYAECRTDEVYLPPIGCEDHERKEYNHVRESFTLRIKKWEDVHLPDKDGRVECLDWPKYDPETCRTEPLHQALCRREKAGCPPCECGGCVVLATILVRPPRYGRRDREVRVDTCTYRTLVYRNRLLYELIHCLHGDLPHIVDLSWASAVHPERVVEWDTFVQLMDDGLAVTFDREMDPATLNPHTFIVTFLDRQEGTHGELVRRRIPGTIQSGWRERCYQARFVPDDKWLKYRLKSGDSPLSYGEDVEILIRGNNVKSRTGKALDGEFIGLPTGNGSPGGEFVDYFRVLKHGESKIAARRYEDF